MNANFDVIPERGYIEYEISRAERRMNTAKTLAWKHRWCGVMARKINARNAVMSARAVRRTGE